jgi:transposase
MYQKYQVKLTEAERYQLKQLVSSGTAPARQIRRAQILLKSDCSPEGPNWTYKAIYKALDVSNVTVTAVRRAYVEGGMEAVLTRKKPDRIYEHRLDGEKEAYLIALACGEAPAGQERWTLRLLRDRFIKLGHVDNISHETIRTTLKKTNLSLG